jgi:hypothetical protein
MKMRHKVRAVSALLVTMGAVGVVGVTARPGGASASPKSVRVAVLDRDPFVIEQAPTGLSTGDVLLFEEPLVDPKSGETVGGSETRVQVIETLPGDDARFILDCTFRLAKGNLTFTGSELFSHIASGLTFAVVGGTDRFTGAAGSVHLTPTKVKDQTGSLAVFTLEDRDDD